MRKAFFRKSVLLHRKVDFLTKTATKMTFFTHGGITKKIFVVYVDMVSETLSQKFHSYSILAG